MLCERSDVAYTRGGAVVLELWDSQADLGAERQKLALGRT